MKLCCLFTVVAWSLPVSATVVEFTDGELHSLPSDAAFNNGDFVVAENASTSISVSSTAIIGDGSTRFFTGAGPFPFPGPGTRTTDGISGLRAVSGASAELLGGLITGQSVNAVQTGIVSGNDQPFFVAGAGVLLNGGGNISSTSGSIIGGNAVGTDTDNLRAGSGIVISDSASRSILENTVVQGGNATTTVTSGFVGDVQIDATAGIGLDVRNSELLIEGGTFSGGSAQGILEDPTFGNSGRPNGGFLIRRGGAGLRASRSVVEIGSGSFFGGDIQADDAASSISRAGPGIISSVGQLTVRDGFFQGGSGSVSGAGLLVETTNLSFDTVLDIQGGVFQGGTGEQPGSGLNLTGVFLGETFSSNTVEVSIAGGTFQGKYGLDLNLRLADLDATESELNELYSFTILGGDFVGEGGVDISLTGGLGVDVVGEQFFLDGNIVEPGSITAQGGTLTGVLSDGSSFDWTFLRDEDTSLNLVLVPEPSSMFLLVFGASTIITRRSKAS